MNTLLDLLLLALFGFICYSRGRSRGEREARLRGYQLLIRQARSYTAPEPSQDTDWAVEVTYNILNPEE